MAILFFETSNKKAALRDGLLLHDSLLAFVGGRDVALFHVSLEGAAQSLESITFFLDQPLALSRAGQTHETSHTVKFEAHGRPPL
jgi:hypothetical protein